MSEFRARTYQEEAIEAVQNQWEAGKKRVLVVMPTGTGKTIVFAKIIENLVAQGKRVLVLAHRTELLKQAKHKIGLFTNIKMNEIKTDTSLEKEGEKVSVLIASIQELSMSYSQQLANGKKISWIKAEEFPVDYFDVIIVDEAHHVMADSYQDVLQYFNDAQVLGVTATPERSDIRDLGQFFDCLAYEYTMTDAIAEGYVVPISVQNIPLTIDIRNVRVFGTEYSKGDLADTLDHYFDQLAAVLAKECKGRKTVIFVPLVRTAEKLAAVLSRKGLRAVEIDGTKKQTTILERFRNGEYDVIVNALLLTEGWDCPEVDCIVCLRPTKSKSLYAQMVGRGTRPAPGKEKLLILDFLWQANSDDICHPSSLVCKSQEIMEIMDKRAQASTQAIDVFQLLDKAKEEYVFRKENALIQRLVNSSYNGPLVDPMQYAACTENSSLLSYEACFEWEKAKAPDFILQQLERLGIYTGDIPGFGFAKQLLEDVMTRREKKLASPPQIKALAEKGCTRFARWSVEKASRILAE